MPAASTQLISLKTPFVGGKGMNQNAFTLGTEIPAAGGTLKLVANYGFGKVKSADQVTFDDNKVKSQQRQVQ